MLLPGLVVGGALMLPYLLALKAGDFYAGLPHLSHCDAVPITAVPSEARSAQNFRKAPVAGDTARSSMAEKKTRFSARATIPLASPFLPPGASRARGTISSTQG